jgi:hypothetical protein
MLIKDAVDTLLFEAPSAKNRERRSRDRAAAVIETGAEEWN